MKRLWGGESEGGEPAGTELARAVDDGAANRGRPARIGARSSRSGSSPARVSSPHTAKFRLATGFLLGIGVAALVIAAALAVHPASRGSNRAWSPWSPTTAGKLGVTEIADHVAPYYRLTAATQMDVVTPINLANPNDQGTTTGSGLTVAVNTGASGSASSLSLLNGKTVAYNLCGTGPSDCHLPGTASAARMLLLRREALELALYTFKYVGGTENVVCVLPPGTTQVTSTLSPKLPKPGASSSDTKPVTIAVVFLREDLQPWLDQPLSSTLSPYELAASEASVWQKTDEAGLVDQITAHGLFSEQIESQQTGGNLLVLNQMPAQ